MASTNSEKVKADPIKPPKDIDELVARIQHQLPEGPMKIKTKKVKKMVAREMGGAVTDESVVTQTKQVMDKIRKDIPQQKHDETADSRRAAHKSAKRAARRKAKEAKEAESNKSGSQTDQDDMEEEGGYDSEEWNPSWATDNEG